MTFAGSSRSSRKAPMQYFAWPLRRGSAGPRSTGIVDTRRPPPKNVTGESGNTAFARKIISQERNVSYVCTSNHFRNRQSLVKTAHHTARNRSVILRAGHLFAWPRFARDESPRPECSTANGLNGGPRAFRRDHHKPVAARLMAGAINHDMYVHDIAVSGKQLQQLFLGNRGRQVVEMYLGIHSSRFSMCSREQLSFLPNVF